MLKKIYILTVTLFCLFGKSFGQSSMDANEQEAQNITVTPPKIGLALSGGAAHGLAHIGVIKYMEEIGIPVDYITGTSMGSIIGGLLAMGYDSDEMTEIAENLNWDEILSSRTRLDEVAPIEKFYHDKFPILLTWEDKELILPSGILGGQKLDLTLSRIFFPALAVDNFDDLVIPFRCMAVDISTGEILTLESGYLGQAIRASMAIPMIFSPVELDGRLLVDGGLRRNFPVQENLEMGADFIIGVYVGSQKFTKEELKSSIDILVQSTQMMGIMDSERQMGLCDILVFPEVKDYGTLDFKNYKKFIDAGYEAAKLNTEEFLKLKARLQTESNSIPSQKIELPEKMYINNIATPSLSPTLRNIALNRSGLSPRSYVKLNEIDKGLARIYGTKNFQNLNYIFSQDENNETNLVINSDPARKTEFGASFNRFASSNSAIILSAILRNKISEPSRFTLVGRVSDNPGLKADYFRRVGEESDLYLRLFAAYDQIDKPLFLDFITRPYKSKNSEIGMSLGYEKDNALKIEGGFRFDREVLEDLAYRQEFTIDYTQAQQITFIGATYNTLSSTAYYNSGIRAAINLSFHANRDPMQFDLEEDDKIGTGFASFEKVKNINPSLTSISSAYGFFKIGKGIFENLLVGGTEQSRINNAPFIGLAEGSLNFNNAILVRQEFRVSPLRNIYISGIANIVIGDQGVGSDWIGSGMEENVIFGAGFKIGVDSPIGPVDLEIGANSSGHVKTALGVGYRFIF